MLSETRLNEYARSTCSSAGDCLRVVVVDPSCFSLPYDYSLCEGLARRGAEVTLATLPISPDEVPRFGVVEVGKGGEVLGFEEKPKATTFRSPFNPNAVDASMGIYIFNTEVLLKALIADAEDPASKHDFGHNILPNLLGKKKMMA